VFASPNANGEREKGGGKEKGEEGGGSGSRKLATVSFAFGPSQTTQGGAYASGSKEPIARGVKGGRGGKGGKKRVPSSPAHFLGSQGAGPATGGGGREYIGTPITVVGFTTEARHLVRLRRGRRKEGEGKKKGTKEECSDLIFPPFFLWKFPPIVVFPSFEGERREKRGKEGGNGMGKTGCLWAGSLRTSFATPRLRECSSTKREGKRKGRGPRGASCSLLLGSLRGKKRHLNLPGGKEGGEGGRGEREGKMPLSATASTSFR